jgi:hypothetical protein
MEGELGGEGNGFLMGVRTWGFEGAGVIGFRDSQVNFTDSRPGLHTEPTAR